MFKVCCWGEGRTKDPSFVVVSTCVVAVTSMVVLTLWIHNNNSNQISNKKDETDKSGEDEKDSSATSCASQEQEDQPTQLLLSRNTSGAKFYKWAKKFRRSDPRFRILEFLHNVEQDGCKNMCEMDAQHRRCLEGCFQSGACSDDGNKTTTSTHSSSSLDPNRPSYVDVPSSCWNRAGVFSVWRPCSYEAIKKMMTGQGVGKGLDIKGKSAKQGKLSGFVPFLQIHEEKHKGRVKTLPKEARMRLFFKSRQSRTKAMEILEPLAKEMRRGYATAKRIIEEDEHSLRDALRASTLVGGIDFAWDSVRDGETISREEALNRYQWDIGDEPAVELVDDYATNGFYGIDLLQRLFWEAYVMRQSIARDGPDYDTGRPSCAEFQDCNCQCLGKDHTKGDIIPVVLQYKEDPDDAMDVQNLLMAYENNDRQRVMPVVSDFDCFLMGTRRVSFHKPLPEEQKSILKWQVSKIRSILDGPDRDETWTMQWIEMLKQEASEKGNYEPPKVPKFGFGDPKSYFILGHAAARLEDDGCVRHGAECFNYRYPQDLDDKFFVISSRSEKLSLELDREELVAFLSQKADEGYVFPLNPKWILCDLGFKQIYDKLMANEKLNAQTAMNTWYPPETGVREMIAAIHHDHPDGFQRTNRMYHMSKRRYSPLRQCMYAGYDIDGATAMEMALMELQHYCTMQKCRVASHAIIASIRMYAKIQVYNKKQLRESSGSIVPYPNNDRSGSMVLYPNSDREANDKE